MDDHTLLVIFVSLFAVFVVLQAFVLIGLLVAIRKAIAAVTQTSNDIKATLIPLAQTTRGLVARISPQVVTVAQGLAELTETVRKETNGIKVSASEIMERVNKQTQRLDIMLTEGLNVLERAAHLMESAVSAPVRQANGIFAAIKAMVDTYRSPSPRRTAHGPSTAGYTTGNSTKTKSDFEI